MDDPSGNLWHCNAMKESSTEAKIARQVPALADF
jgi:hypothetical protein